MLRYTLRVPNRELVVFNGIPVTGPAKSDPRRVKIPSKRSSYYGPAQRASQGYPNPTRGIGWVNPEGMGSARG